MLRFLVKGEDLQVVEVALAVVAPWTSHELFQRRTASFLAHCVCRNGNLVNLTAEQSLDVDEKDSDGIVAMGWGKLGIEVTQSRAERKRSQENY